MVLLIELTYCDNRRETTFDSFLNVKTRVTKFVRGILKG
jgi:hypothetical protein